MPIKLKRINVNEHLLMYTKDENVAMFIDVPEISKKEDVNVRDSIKLLIKCE